MVRTCAVAIALALWCAAVIRAADVTDRVTQTVPLAPGRAIQVDTTVGDVTIVGSNRPDIAVEIVRRAPSSDSFSKFPVVIDNTGDALRVGAAQTAGGRDPALISTVVIRAPANANFRSIRMFEGRLRISGLTAACDADVRRGSIEATALAGRVRLETGLGSVDVKDAALAPGGMLRVQLAHAPENARILAVTLNGQIRSDIPLTMKDQFGPRFGETTLGNGEPVMSLDVVKGDIAISVAR